MTTRNTGPKLVVGVTIGLLIGFLAVLNIYLAGATVLLGLFLLGRYAPNSPIVQATAEADRDVANALRHRQWLDAQAKRNGYWLRFPLQDIPGETHRGRHLDRVFTPYGECDQGHCEHHHMGRLFIRDGVERVARSCANSDCTCTWSELIVGGDAR